MPLKLENSHGRGNSHLRNKSGGSSGVKRRLELESQYGRSLLNSQRDLSQNEQRVTTITGSAGK